MLSVCLAGATGWTGRAIARGVLAAPDERLTIRHDAGSTPEPYVAGTLMAVRAAPGLVGLTRGLDTLLFST